MQRAPSELCRYRALYDAIAADFDAEVAQLKRRGRSRVRTGTDRFDELLDEPGTSMVVMRNRPMTGWLDVDADHLLATARLRFWIEVGVAFACTLPAQ